MSRFLPTVIVANIYKKLDIPFNQNIESEIPKMVLKGFNQLYSMQHNDGGWGWWTYDKSNPYMSAYALYGLSLSQKAGYEVDKEVIRKGTNYLVNIIRKDKIDSTTLSFALYTLSGIDPDYPRIYREMFDKLEGKKLNDFANSLLSLTAANISDTEHMQRYNDILFRNREKEDNDKVYWGGKIFHYNWEEDRILTTSLALKAMLGDSIFAYENKDIIEKAVNWLIYQRKPYGWGNTVQNAFIIYSLAGYMENDNGLNPDYSVNVIINGFNIGEKRFTKDDVFKKAFTIDITGDKLKTGDNEIKIEKSGEGRLYFSSGTTYYSSEPGIEAKDKGFKVEKEYYKLEMFKDFEWNEITYKKEKFNGSVKSGDMILVKINVKAKENVSQYFMLEDPIPAGCVVIKDDWAYNIIDEKNYSGRYGNWRWWYADKEVHDNRVSFFATYLYGDEYEFSYILRAQIPGKYNVNPAIGVLMYYPDVKGSSEGMKIKIRN
jgi:hypothetical protein